MKKILLMIMMISLLQLILTAYIAVSVLAEKKETEVIEAVWVTI